MQLHELKIILKRLYQEYVKNYLNKIFLALILSIIVALSTSSIAWLLDPAVKKIFIEKDKVLAWAIPLLIVIFIISKNIFYERFNINIDLIKICNDPFFIDNNLISGKCNVIFK